ncbi:MAG: sugar ABC transporter ATP-binding protein [Rhodospirillaceae bacterium]|nr:sugar ABC transporter ATP-binding protein [Rhodospirillaceae bacterium]
MTIENTSPDAVRPQVSIHGLQKSFGGLRAVKHVDLNIYSGEVLAIVGDNGAGKSTLIKMLAGVVVPDEGEIQIRGEKVEINNPNDARELGIETLYQELGLVDTFNVPENIFLGRELTTTKFGVPVMDHKEMKRRTQELLERIDVQLPSLDRPVRSYSGGQRQAIAISRLLIEDVNLIIMDEPMAALGIDESSKVLRLITNLRDKGEAIVVISHNLDHVFSVADKVAVMKNGALVDVVSTDEVGHDELVTMIVSGKPHKRDQAPN